MRGDVPLQTGTDIQCYNHTLETPFDCPPSVAIGTPLITQVSTISKAHPAITSSSQSKLLTLTATLSSPSSSVPNGLIPVGQKSTSSSLLNHLISSKPATIKSIQPLFQLVCPENKLLPSFPPNANPINGKLSPILTDSKLAQLIPREHSILPTRFK